MPRAAAITASAFDQLGIEIRATYSALREAEAQSTKSGERAEKAAQIAARDRQKAEQLRLELGRQLLRMRAAWPERGPKAKGWGEFLEKEGIEQSTAWRLMEAAKSGGDFMHEGRLHEIPHPAEGGDPATQPDPPRKAFGQILDLPLYLGRWEDVLSSAEVGQVDVLITDAPYSKRTHESTRGMGGERADGYGMDGLAPTYDSWAPEDAIAFVEAWSPRVRGWMACLCDHTLIPTYQQAYERMGRYVFAPVPCVIRGMSVRLAGDGPSSEAVYLMVARPATAEFKRWGTLPGAYTGGRDEGAKGGRGKPRWLIDAIVRDYSRPGDLVCDPLAGYGVTLISALLQRRRAIGAEMDEAAVEEAFRRAKENQEPVTGGDEAAQPEGNQNP